MLSASARSCHPQTLHKALSVLCLLPWQVLPAPQSSYSFECASVTLTLFRALLWLSMDSPGERPRRRIAADELVGLLTVLQACGVRPMAAAVCAGVIRQGWAHLPMLAISSKGAGGCCHWSRCPCGHCRL